MDSHKQWSFLIRRCFQFLGIPTKGELNSPNLIGKHYKEFPISRDPPKGGTDGSILAHRVSLHFSCFQFLGIPPKGEPQEIILGAWGEVRVSNF